MAENSKILVGKIVAVQGLRGDVRVQTYTASPNDFRNLQVESNRFAVGALKFVRLLNPTSDVVIAHVDGFDDRTSAEALRGTELFINRDDLPELSENEYYQTDLIGMPVVRGGENIGVVAGFQNFGAGDIVELDSGEMISFAIAEVDAKKRHIYIK